MEDRIAVSEHKVKVLDLYNQVTDLLNDDELTDQNKIILKKAQQSVQFENKKLATLTQSQYLSVSEQLEEIQTTLDQMKKKAKKAK